jgi:hypothetical protein
MMDGNSCTGWSSSYRSETKNGRIEAKTWTTSRDISARIQPASESRSIAVRTSQSDSNGTIAMKAVIFEQFGQPPRVATVADPAPAATGVVIKVEATGLCRSDWHGWMGHDPDIVLPHVPGHELAGSILAIGKQVTSGRSANV